jgi:hypothetical protein
VVPADCIAWNGYVLPRRGRVFKRADLIELAGANGFQLSVALLHKWRAWRLLPAPAPGGPTGVGRGKGQTWPEGAGWRTAWIARWHADTLSYDVLRLALWPWTPELERDRAADLLAAIPTFVRQDEDFHDRLEATLSETDLEAVDPYVTLMREGQSGLAAEVLRRAGVKHGSDAMQKQQPFVAQLSFGVLKEMPLDERDLVGFIRSLRTGLAQRQLTLIELFWNGPLSLARIVVREFLRYRLGTNKSR